MRARPPLRVLLKLFFYQNFPFYPHISRREELSIDIGLWPTGSAHWYAYVNGDITKPALDGGGRCDNKDDGRRERNSRRAVR